MIGAGELDQRVQFLRKSEQKNPDGSLEDVTEKLHACWAHVRPLSGSERRQAQQVETPSTFRVWVRNTQSARTVQGSDFMRWQGQDMRITWAPPASPRPLYLEMEVQAGVVV